MNEKLESLEMEILVVITNDKQGEKVMHLAQEKGAGGATIFHGEGTVRKRLLQILGIDSIKKEIVLMIVPKEVAINTLDYIAETEKLDKKNKGIAFRMPLTQLIGVNTKKVATREENKIMFQAIFTIVNKGEAEEVMEVAQDAGARGGTIIMGRGAGRYETKKVFNMEIEPEKEIVLIISEESQTQAIVDAINTALELEKPNTGVLFVNDLSDTRGLV